MVVSYFTSTIGDFLRGTCAMNSGCAILPLTLEMVVSYFTSNIRDGCKLFYLYHWRFPKRHLCDDLGLRPCLCPGGFHLANKVRFGFGWSSRAPWWGWAARATTWWAWRSRWTGCPFHGRQEVHRGVMTWRQDHIMYMCRYLHLKSTQSVAMMIIIHGSCIQRNIWRGSLKPSKLVLSYQVILKGLRLCEWFKDFIVLRQIILKILFCFSPSKILFYSLPVKVRKFINFQL